MQETEKCSESETWTNMQENKKGYEKIYMHACIYIVIYIYLIITYLLF